MIKTKDGSYTLAHHELDATYHSTHGAITESQVVFIKNGLDFILQDKPSEIRILEIGLGTGLNFLLSLIQLEDYHGTLIYDGIEKYPLSSVEIKGFQYVEQLNASEAVRASYFHALKNGSYDNPIDSLNVQFNMIREDFVNHPYPSHYYDLIYYDAFGPGVQPDLWTDVMAGHMSHALKPGGVLVTYSVQGQWRRALKKFEFTNEKLPGPPGKREVLRSIKKTG